MGTIRRGKVAVLISATRLKTIQVLMCVIFFYMLLIGLEIPLVLRAGIASFSGDGLDRIIDGAFIKPFDMQSEDEVFAAADEGGGVRHRIGERRMGELRLLSGLAFDGGAIGEEVGLFSELEKTAKRAWLSGKKLWDELEAGKVEVSKKVINHTVNCPDSVSLSEKDFRKNGKMMVIPCGLTIGSHIAIVGKPLMAHVEHEPKISHLKEDEENVLVSQFVMELQGLNTVDGEEAPKILHFNPRLKGDWSEKAVIEHNTCFRMQWGTPLRCEGWKSRADEETVDGQVKCEKWIRDDDNHSEESKITWWLSRLIGKTKKITVDWPYPFMEEKLFVLTLSAGLEGYHINIDGKHVTSFPYRTGFVLEDATGLSINGDVDVHTVIAASLPSSHPRFAPEELLEMLGKWQAPPLPQGQVELFIGVLSAGNHFLERMAMRKSWMQHKLVKSSNVVTRFFVALHGRNKVNIELKKEAEYFGDIVIVPYMDNYELVVLKTVAICEYGVRAINAKYVMKCDDDTFVRIDAILDQARRYSWRKSVYMGNINYHHKPLRYGKWAVTYEEWPEEDYPPYANGPGYLLSADIARFIVSLFEKHKLRLFKMEDVSMGMWVEQFNGSRRVAYVHSLKFCQFGCIGGYYTAHYQSPRQMMCLWDKLQRQGRPLCCDARR